MKAFSAECFLVLFLVILEISLADAKNVSTDNIEKQATATKEFIQVRNMNAGYNFVNSG